MGEKKETETMSDKQNVRVTEGDRQRGWREKRSEKDKSTSERGDA